MTAYWRRCAPPASPPESNTIPEVRCMMRRLSILFVVAAVLGGCSGSVLESKKVDYKSAGKLPPLEIPPDLTAPARDERYAVPDITPRGSATFSPNCSSTRSTLRVCG